jgi:hypothetical protein
MNLLKGRTIENRRIPVIIMQYDWLSMLLAVLAAWHGSQSDNLPDPESDLTFKCAFDVIFVEPVKSQGSAKISSL